jgi:hypothetical protein
MGTAWGPFSPNVCQQIGMGCGHFEVVELNRNSVENRINKALPLLPSAPFRQLDANPQLRHRNRGDRDIIAVVDCITQRVAPALSVN